MYKLCIFAGTSEGRELAEFLKEQPVETTVCVATEYGQTLLPEGENMTVSARRLPVEEIRALLAASRFDLVIDATHPYAASITGSIVRACAEEDTEYLRLLRPASHVPQGAVCVPDTAAAVEFLKGTQGNILLTTGSKELAAYAALPDFEERVYARVLPVEASLAACRAAGVKTAHILAMQGPFTEELDAAMLRAVDAAWLVTKDGGAAGGFMEKAAAAKAVGAGLVVVGRPQQREGLSLSETVALLCRRFGCGRTPRVAVVGMGPGSAAAMTGEVRRALGEADCLIGAARMLRAVAAPGQATHTAIAPQEIAAFIRSHPEHERFAVVMSGDTGFFSGTKKLLPLLEGCHVQVLPGLSSLAYLCARAKTSYEDVYLTSVHGRDHDIVPDVRAHGRVFTLVGGADGVDRLCRTLVEHGLGYVRLCVGERLSYPDERVTCGTAEQLLGGTFDALSAVLLENDRPDAVVTHGLPDSAFIRGGEGRAVPMTKSEVRSVCLSKLRLTEGAVCWDIGAGTGSVSIEMALQAKRGQVYAIERRQDALALLAENKKRLCAENLTIIDGCAPEACADLPAPSHAFIGGSSGNMREILTLLLEKTPRVRVVATAIALESVAELTACMRELPFAETEVISMQVASGRQAGDYHLMTGQNPIYIFTLQGGEAAV